MLRKFMMMFVLADNYITNLAGAFFRKQWKLEGKCRKCGKCCKEIHMKVEPHLIGNRFTRELVIRWISWLFNFYLIRIDYDRDYLVFSCRSINPDGTCGDYRWRPSVCRNYPLVDYFDEPALLEGCGFRAVSSRRAA
jgi:Fe-S-cluster containining protein